jgi:hypothetical protein
VEPLLVEPLLVEPLLVELLLVELLLVEPPLLVKPLKQVSQNRPERPGRMPSAAKYSVIRVKMPSGRLLEMTSLPWLPSKQPSLLKSPLPKLDTIPPRVYPRQPPLPQPYTNHPTLRSLLLISTWLLQLLPH